MAPPHHCCWKTSLAGPRLDEVDHDREQDEYRDRADVDQHLADGHEGAAQEPVDAGQTGEGQDEPQR